jgi:prophage antirepressor-like protein
MMAFADEMAERRPLHFLIAQGRCRRMDDVLSEKKKEKIAQQYAPKESEGREYHFESKKIRIIEIAGEIWWVAKDVCDALGHANSRMAIKELDEDEKGVSKVYTLGGMQELTIISESGLYSLILRSNKPKAKKFRKWVTSEVLPSIRKHGAYVAQGKQGELRQLYEDMKGHASKWAIGKVAMMLASKVE